MGLLIRKDLIQSTEQMKSGWSLVKLVKVEEKAAKGEGQYINTTLVFEGLAGPENEEVNAGRQQRYMISGKALESNVGIVAERMLQFLQAATGIQDRNEFEGVVIEFKDYLNAEVWMNVQPELNKSDNKTYPTPTGFAHKSIQPF